MGADESEVWCRYAIRSNPNDYWMRTANEVAKLNLPGLVADGLKLSQVV